MPTPAVTASESSAIRSITIRACFLELFYWFGVATYTAFMVSTLIDQGWSRSLAAGVMTLCSVALLISQPVVGYIVDRYLTEKKLLIGALLVGAVALAALPLSLSNGSKSLIFANLLLYTLTGSSMANFIDAWVVGLKQEFPSINYGLIRGMGSISYAISAFIIGYMSVSHGLSLRYIIGAASTLIALFIALSLREARKDIDYRPGEKDADPLPETAVPAVTIEEGFESLTEDMIIKDPVEPEPGVGLSGREALRLVFQSKAYNLLLTVAALLCLAGTSITTLLQIAIVDLGGNTADIGTGTFVMAMSEFPTMILVAYFFRYFRKSQILLVACFFYIVRMVATGMAMDLSVIIAVQALQSVSNAVFIALSMSFISEMVDSRVRSTGVAFYSAIGLTVPSILGNLFSTFMLGQGFTAQQILLILTVFPALAAVFTAQGILRKTW